MEVERQKPRRRSELEPSPLYSFVRSRELEGTYPGTADVGTWITTALRVAKGWGSPPEDAWPYETANHWPPKEPRGLDGLAKRHRVFAYSRVRSLDACRIALSRHQTVMAAFAIDASWGTCDGHVGDPRACRPDGAHSILLVGYNDKEQHLIFANSWGTSWGDRGYGYLPYRYWSERLLEAWLMDDPRPAPPASTLTEGVAVRALGINDTFDRVLHVIEIEDLDQDEMLGWAFTVEVTGWLEVEEIFVRPAYRGEGSGRELARSIADLGAARGLPIKCWIPHADWAGMPTPEQAAVFGRLGLTTAGSTERWAAAVAVT